MKQLIEKLWETLDGTDGAEAEEDLKELHQALTIAAEYVINTAASKRCRLVGDIEAALFGETMASHCLKLLYHMIDPGTEAEAEAEAEAGTEAEAEAEAEAPTEEA